ncbi:hypothetical protein NEIELOOT_02569 [Neisseria elongata subsp. glycolytica ATCC 29315]|uniref:Uncharacterized protein n=1 Tax=Neisseria elongata subsp. glycolytica ATCC 29315 TaxID=546263 RepID=D4DU12_NEIEG|nr:hypothetical protein NEIELOOT_02569 [Neisseria elongata subsp. glycolytica ATCC 29315]
MPPSERPSEKYRRVFSDGLLTSPSACYSGLALNRNEAANAASV